MEEGCSGTRMKPKPLSEETEMTNPNPAATVDSVIAPSQPAEQFDLSKYRTPELFDEIASLLSIKGAFFRVIISLVLASIGAGMAIWLIWHYSELTLVPSLMLCGYALIVSVVAGAGLSFLRIAIAAISSIDAILKLVLRLTDQVVLDHAQMQSGEMQMLSGPELSRRIFEDVIIVGVKKVLSRNFGFLATPIEWCYRLTVRPIANRFFRRAAAAEASDALPSERGIKAVETVASHADKIKRYTGFASRIVGGTVTAARRFAFWPMVVFFTVSLFLATAPIVWIVLWSRRN